MSRHEGVSCDACVKGNFKGRRYKCLICFDYDLCSACYENGATTSQHATSHPMQCIITRQDFEMYHGGQTLASDAPQSVTCPFCGRMGFTESTLQEHVTANHLVSSVEVICPICASVPGGEPNQVTDDFAAHLTLDHPTGAPRDMEMTENATRHRVRPMPNQHVGPRGLNRGMARQNIRSMSSGLFSSSSSRGDAMDPIAELLSQLSGVRRATAFETAHRQRQQQQQQLLERLPTRRTTASSGTANNSQAASVPNGNAPPIAGISDNGESRHANATVGSAPSGVMVVNLGANSAAQQVSVSTPTTSSTPHGGGALPKQSSHGQSQFLLTRLSEDESSSSPSSDRDRRAAFTQELLLSTLSHLSLDVSPPVALPTVSIDASTQTPPPIVPLTQPALPPKTTPPVKATKPPPSKIVPPPRAVTISQPPRPSGETASARRKPVRGGSDVRPAQPPH